MHSTIFQITTERVRKGCFLNEDTLTQGDGANIDYCGNITEEERRERIERLVNNILPKGMFTLMEDSVLRYNGGAEKWKKEWVRNIKAQARRINVNNVTISIGPMYDLEQAVNNPLDCYSLFYFDKECIDDYAERSGELMNTVCRLKANTLLYIGGVVDYHF